MTSRKDVFFVSQVNDYEKFRTILAMNLFNVLQADQLPKVMEAIDISLHDFEVRRKDLDIIPIGGTPEVAKLFLASKAIANLSKGTLRQYHYKLINFFRDVPKSYMDITPNDIRMYLYNYRATHNSSDCYIDNIRITLNTFFQWLTDNEYLPRNPCAKVDKIKYHPKRRKPMSMYELEYFRWNTINAREKALIDFLFSTGLRVSECADVQLTDIDWGNRSVHVRHGKGNKERTVFFNAEAEVSMKEYLDSREDNCNALFVSKRNPVHQIQSHALENIVKKISKRTGVEAYPHKFRHTFATFGLHSGMPLEKLQLLLGHTNPKTTLIYADQDKADVKHEYSKTYA